MANNNKKKSGSKSYKGSADVKKASNYNAAKQKKQQPRQASGQKQPQKKKRGGILNYFRGVRQEFKKVVWLTREELTTDTVVVIACVAFFALAFWLIDTGFLAALKGILGITLS